jgi:3'-phosphoadenosine 5'-phosphosulfate sulfotransferase (PAPS reductase)/FAD synthetase
MNIKRVVCWFSCGATSAVATKLAIEKYSNVYPIVVAYCDTKSEHSDNARFLQDCEKWFGLPIMILHSNAYNDIWEVFNKRHFMVNIKGGAACSDELKKFVRRSFEDLEGDLQIFGFDADEQGRAERFVKNNPETCSEFPLIDFKYTKSDCILTLQKAEISIPIMYKLGYKNNNCIGCVKGGMGYWNKIRVDFPDIYMNKWQR